jgi:hypothetical protein
MPINEVAVTAVMTRPEFISPGDAEAGLDGLEPAAGPDRLGFTSDGPRRCELLAE